MKCDKKLTLIHNFSGSEILFPVINEHHRLILAAVEQIVRKIHLGEEHLVYELLFGLFNKLERYYATHDFMLKQNYCCSCKKQIAVRQHILDLILNACILYEQKKTAETLATLQQLTSYLNASMYSYQDQ